MTARMDTSILNISYRAAVNHAQFVWWVWCISKDERRRRERKVALTVPVGLACSICCKSDVVWNAYMHANNLYCHFCACSVICIFAVVISCLHWGFIGVVHECRCHGNQFLPSLPPVWLSEWGRAGMYGFFFIIILRVVTSSLSDSK